MHDGSVLTLERRSVSIVGRGDAGNIGDIFGQCLLAVYGKIRKWFVRVVLSGEFGRGSTKVSEVRRRPPIPHAPCGIECAALRIEGVADLMPNHGANGAIVRSVRR